MSQVELIAGPAGHLEVLAESPRGPSSGVLAVICHPHPQHGGTMTNKVVATIARSLQKKGVTTVRFNYRGVGQSDGKYDHARGEVDDLLAVVKWAETQFAHNTLWLAGFSFGSYVAANAATRLPAVAQLITVAPSVENMDYASLPQIDCPWLVIQGESDEIVNPEAVFAYVGRLAKAPNLVRLPGVGHFFHSRLLDLEQILHEHLDYPALQ